MTPNAPARLGAVILAAGASRRMGSPKALLQLDSRPLISHLLDSFRASGFVSNIAVVTGHDPAPIEAAASRKGVTILHNADHETGGMLSSVKVGVAELSKKCDAIFIALLDQPLVRAATITTLATRWRDSRAALTISTYNGKRGHPIVVASARAVEILSLPEDATLRDFVAQHLADAEVVPVADPGVVTVLDTPGDFENLKELWRSQSCRTEQA